MTTVTLNSFTLSGPAAAELDLSVDVAKVTKACNGQVGCMCGCLGDYAYSTGAHAELSDSMKNYNKANDRKVKSRVNSLLKMVASGDADEVQLSSSYLYASRGNRCFCVYFD